MRRSPRTSCSHTPLSFIPTAETMERPSRVMAMPASWAGPEVICSGLPAGKGWRHRWLEPLRDALKYIHFPSGDQVAEVHGPGGPTCEPNELPSKGTNRQRCQAPVGPISTTKTQLRSGEAEE